MKRRKLFLFAITVCLLFSACTVPVNKPAEELPIQIALTQDILSFDPMMTTDIFSEAVLRCVYTTLYDFDENLNLRPKLVNASTMLDDYTWKMEIHEGVKFQDGSVLTAEDVVFSIQRAMKGGRTQKLLEIVESVEKVDDTTFLLRSREPYPNLPFLFAKAETSIVSKKAVESPGYDFSAPVGAGPFKVISRAANDRICLERFDDYYLDKAASRYLNFLVLMSEQDRTAAFLNGDVDILFSVSAYDCEKLKLSQGVKLLHHPSSKIEYLSLNNTHPPLDDPRVRLAISYAVNRQTISDNVYHGYAVPSASLIPNGITGHLDGLVTYDPQKARELLQEAGQENGFSFNVITIDTIRKNTLEYMKLDLAKIGITLNYQLVTMKEAVDLMTAGEHDSILVGWAYTSDPNSVLPLVLGTGSGKTMNSSNYSNPNVDDLIRAGRKEADTILKQKIYEQINRIVTEDAPMVILGNPMVLSAAKDDIEGIYLNAQGLIQYELIYRTKKQ